MSAASPAPAAPAPAAAAVPGKTLGVVGLVFSLLGLFLWYLGPLLGLILGGIGKSQSKKAGVPNGAATAAIIISIILLVVHVILTIAFIGSFAALFGGLAAICAEYGNGEHVINGVTYTCNI